MEHEFLRLHPDARTVTDPSGETYVFADYRGTNLGVLSSSQSAALALLATELVDGEALPAAVHRCTGEGDPAEVDRLLEKLRATGWLSVTLRAHGARLVTFRPLGPSPHPARASAGDPAALRLSRFAVMRREDSGLILESPLAHVVVELHDPAVAALLAELGEPEGARSVPRPEWLPTVVGALASHGFLVPRDGGTETDFHLAQWSPHELMFHSRSRLGRHDSPYGATYWAKGLADPLPAVRPSFGGPKVELPRADLQALRVSDQTLTTVLEDRRSLRHHDDTVPLTLTELGEFLYRSARNRQITSGGLQQLTDRPYPSGGQTHELEIYPLINHVQGIAPGLYHYDPEGHTLELIAQPGRHLVRLSAMSQASAGMSAPPQVVLFVTARFGRVMRKYSGLGYALVLKHVGVLYQVMYSVATAMGLAGCALGGGDSDAFAAATGISWEAESTVGEFLLGSPAGDRESPAQPGREYAPSSIRDPDREQDRRR